MNTTLKLVDVIKKDLSSYIAAIGNNIIYSDSETNQIFTNKGKIHGLNMAISFLDFLATWAKDNPDEYAIPNSFLKVTKDDSKTGSNVFHKIDVDTGLVSTITNNQVEG